MNINEHLRGLFSKYGISPVYYYLRSEVIKQIRDLFDLKQMGAITEEEYDEKREILLKDI